MVKADRNSEAVGMPNERLLAETGHDNEELVKAGVRESGAGLQASSKGAPVRFSGQERHVIEGPSTDVKESIAGFRLRKCASLEEAVAWVERCPNPMRSDSKIEILQIFEAEDSGEALTPELREQAERLRAWAIATRSRDLTAELEAA